jgi:hypothetical protein
MTVTGREQHFQSNGCILVSSALFHVTPTVSELLAFIIESKMVEMHFRLLWVSF